MKIPLFVRLAVMAGTLLTCALPAPGQTQALTPKIIGGENAAANEFGFMAALLTHGVEDVQTAQTGAGALIHPYWVVTAGHCVEGEYPDTMDVLLGATSLKDKAGVQRIRVAEIIRHPLYDPVTFDHDIALLLLASPAAAGLPVLPVIEDPELAAPGNVATAMGWGATWQGGNSSPALLKVLLPILPSDIANLPDWLNGEVTENMLTAGVLQGGRDTCQGDSGGPLVVSGPGGKGVRLAGIVSWGDGCGQLKKPGVYTRVSRYRQWIQERIAPGFSAWEQAAGIQPEDPPDADGDGAPQWLEYAMKTNPSAVEGAASLPVASLAADGAAVFPALTFRRRTDVADFTLNVAFSSDLVSWSLADPETSRIGPALPVPGESAVEQLTVRGGVPVNAADRGFLRLEAGPSRDYQPVRRDIALNSQFESRLNAFDPRLDSRYVREFRLTGLIPGQAVPVSVESLDFQPVVRVRTESGNPVAAGTLSGNTVLLTFIPEDNVNYIIEVSSMAAADTGYFGLTAGVISTGDPLLPAPSAPFDGSLTASDPADPDFLPAVYRYDAYLLTGTNSGESLTVNLTSAAMDMQIYLYDANTGAFLGEHDDISAGNTNARLVFTPQPGRTYRIMATTAVVNQTGSYQIEITR